MREGGAGYAQGRSHRAGPSCRAPAHAASTGETRGVRTARLARPTPRRRAGALVTGQPADATKLRACVATRDRALDRHMSQPRRERSTAPRTVFSVAQIQHVLRVEFSRAARYRYPLSCLSIAVDQLGALRDEQGYEAKEAALEAVVALLVEITRSSDFLGRFADDRLLAVLPHTPADGARLLAGRLLASAHERPVVPGRERLTLSIGGATIGEGTALFHDQLLAASETALAEAAASGGDRFVARAL